MSKNKEVKFTAMQDKPVYNPDPNKILDLAMKCISIKAEKIIDDNQVALFGGAVGDYIVLLPDGKCFVLNAALFHAMFQTYRLTCNCKSDD